MAKVLVTGGAGFIGSHIANALLAQGDTVRIFDDLSTGYEHNVPQHAKCDLVRGSVTDLDALRGAVDGCDYVYHEAALASVPRSVDDPVSSLRANEGGTLNVLVAAKDAGVKRVVYAGSSSAYGDSEVLPKVETMTPNPLSPYAISKLAGEYYMTTFAQIYGLETLTIRYFNVFGPRQDPKGQYAAVIPLFMDAVIRGKAPTIDGDGEQSRDFTFIDNVVDANLRALQVPKLSGEVVNVALGSRVTINELYEKISKILGSGLEAIHGEPRVGDVKHSQADIGAAQRLLGYEQKVSLDDGLERTARWYRSAAESKTA